MVDTSVQVERLRTAPPVKLILETDMSGDCLDVGTLTLLNALADRGQYDLLAVPTNRETLCEGSDAGFGIEKDRIVASGCLAQ